MRAFFRAALLAMPKYRISALQALVVGIIAICAGLWTSAPAWAVEPPNPRGTAALTTLWTSTLRHQYEARDCFATGGFLYVGTGGPEPRIAKLRLADGKPEWSQASAGTYQPSFPVSNGKVVVFGTFGHPLEIVGLDDATGRRLWAVPTKEQNMSAAAFAGELAFSGSYDCHVYAIDWTVGKVKWKTRLGHLIGSKPLVRDNLVLVGC